MAKDTWTRTELFSGLEPTPAFVDELERLGLLRIVARDPRGEALYDADARDTLERVLVLVDAGYAARDIAVIARRVGLKAPKRRLGRRAPTLLRVEDLAEAAEVGVEAARAYWQRGFIEATVLADGGEPLFAAAAVDAARALGELEALGLAAERATWAEAARRVAALEAGPRPPLGAAAALEGLEAAARWARPLGERLARLESAARRWSKRLAVLEKRVEKLRRLHAVELAPVKPRRGLRRKPQTRSSAR